MKRSLLLIMPIAILASCTSNSNNQNNNSDTTKTQISTEKKSVVFEKNTPDLQFYSVKGPVKTIYFGSYSRVDFDKNGNLVSVNGNNPFVDCNREIYGSIWLENYYMKRNDQGYIESEGTVSWVTEYVWKNGQIDSTLNGSEGYCCQTAYHYNNDGILESTDYVEFEPWDDVPKDGWQTTKVDYSKTPKDKHGNFILNNRFIVYYDEDEYLPDSCASYDLAFFEVCGNIKKITQDDEVYEFDKLGNLTKLNGYNPFEKTPEVWDENIDRIYFTRDSIGKIAKIETPYLFEEIYWYDGLPIKKQYWHEGAVCTLEILDTYSNEISVYSWDDMGEGSEPDFSEDPDEKIKISDIKKDSHGNWISRKFGNESQTRTIEYW
ncbi:MAG: hypothetical protein MJ211_02080 [Bacteroidales bacterium]|nr:hypothetical protein [Bacteroidales bacterium]